MVGAALTFSATNNRITTAGYAYDAAGNLIIDVAHTYGFDGENKIKTVDGISNPKIADDDVQRVLVTLDRPINYLNTPYVSAIGSMRHEGASDDLEKGLDVSVNITLLPKEAKAFNDIDSGDFRRGFAAIGSLELV